MSGDWLNGAGLVCNIVGVVAIFLYGVPRYPPVEQAGRGAILLEEEFPEERKQVGLAVWLSRAGLAVLGVGFALQLAALIV